MNHSFLRIVFIVLLAASLPKLQAQRERLTPQEIEFVEKTWPGTKKSSTGIRYIIQKEGSGPRPHTGDRVAMLYRGTLLDGKVFDQRQDPKDPLVFRMGREEVIQGWDQVIPTMKQGEKRLVIIPASLAYGSRGKAPVIPRDAPLVFEMELTAINP
jgi:FKBP-type peptidyl-prolyl cis-trans isomerase